VADDAVVPHQEFELPDGQTEPEDLLQMAGLAHQFRLHCLVEELLGLCGQAFEILARLGGDERFAIVAACREQRLQLR
jgi:hypothetical protein